MAEKEYIEREKTIRNLEKLCVDEKMIGNDNSTYIDFADAIEVVAEQPTADVQEVRHGKWELIDECANEGVYCSNCHKKVYRAKYANQKVKSNYCPNCGAKMDRGEQNVL